METLITVAAASACLATLVLLCARWHLRWTADTADGQPQKIHLGEIPRVGGLCVLMALLAGAGLDGTSVLPLLLLAALPAMLAGFAEDLGVQIMASVRLAVAFVSGGLFIWLTGAPLQSVDVPLADMLLQFTPLAVVFTMFCFAGIVHAMNIVDGVHGLSIGLTALGAGALGAVCLQAGLPGLAGTSFVLMFAALGLLPFNFPAGRIFLGDGGAYLFGSVLAGLSVLAANASDGISPWFPLCLLAYPVIETLHSGLRRRVQSGGLNAAFEADNQHLHTLLHAALLRSSHPFLRRWANPLAGAIVVSASTVVVVLAVSQAGSTMALLLIFLVGVVGYLVGISVLRRAHSLHSVTGESLDSVPLNANSD